MSRRSAHFESGRPAWGRGSETGTPLFRLPLPVPRRTHYELLGIGPEATADEVRHASSEYVDRLRAEGASDEKLAEANAVNLASVDERAAYDEDHPPLALLRLEPPHGPLFEDRDHGLAALRRELEHFLAGRGADVYFPSDTTRTDFTADYTYSPLLDGPRDAA
jgi:hypothetical protein